jgi:uncharacterized RDD family membrane protein YckC
VPRPQDLRASDADREQAVSRLRAAAAEGRLSSDELDDRLHAAFVSQTYGELETVLADLPLPSADRPPEPVPARPSSTDPWGKASGPRAGFWRRFWALCIDNIVCWIIVVVLALILHDPGALLGILVAFGYFIYFEGGERGATPGKSAMGIRIIDAHTGAPIGFGRSALRLIGRAISGLFLDLGYLWMLWDDEKQCWHDKMSHDVVVPTSDYPPQPSR